MPKEFILNIKMLSDWHIGTGSGRAGSVDSLVRKDEYGFPYISGKTCNGILRDACEVVASKLDDGWQNYIELLFGSQPSLNKDGDVLDKPQNAAFQIENACYSDNIRKFLKDKKTLKDALTFVKPSMSVDEKTGMAKDDHLMFEEMARCGAELSAKCSLDLDDYDEDTKKRAFDLLLAGCKFADRIGGKRRRGSGKCEISIKDSNISDFELLREYKEPKKISSSREISKSENSANELKCYKLTITTKSPVCVMTRTVGNIIQSLDYIPGTHIIPILSKKLGESVISDAIKNSNLIVTNAYPVIDGKRSLPVPFCFFQKKLETESIINRSLVKEENSTQLKQWRNVFIDIDNNNLIFTKAQKIVNTHSVVDDKTQSPSDDGVYSIEAIKPNTTFISYIWFDGDIGNDWGDVKIGTAKHAEYGSVTFNIEPCVFENEKRIESYNEGDKLSLWFASDAIFYDDKLRMTPVIDILKAALEKELKDLSKATLEKELGEGYELTPIDTEGLISSATRQERTESWQTSWGLPRPTLSSIKAGSYVKFSSNNEKIPNELIKELEKFGIGERRAEGFGRVIVNPKFEKDYKAEKFEEG
ncbi:MAG: RAMP superfamily CRISPR-associated protein, partial [Armatimonadota bacterium]